jgi:hypothetical protein
LCFSAIADENPGWTAERIAKFFSDDDKIPQDADLSNLEGRTTLKVGFYGTNQTAELDGRSEL